MTKLKTDAALLRALEDSANKATPDELRKQRVSFIMGMLGKTSHITRARVQEVLAKQEGKE